MSRTKSKKFENIEKGVEKNLRPYGRPRVQYRNKKPSMTKQSFREECQIKNIMKKYEKTGIITHVKNHGARYGDFSSHDDYLTALTSVISAQKMFDELPSAVRKKFKNKPEEFLEFVQDPDNLDEMREMGLAPEAPKEEKTIPLIPEEVVKKQPKKDEKKSEVSSE